MNDEIKNPAPFDLVTKILREQCDVPSLPLGRETLLVEELQMESLALLTLITELENHYRVAVALEDDAGFKTIGDIVEYIELRLEQKEGTP